MIHNPFVHTGAAERYHKARPYFHPIVVNKIRRQLGISGKVSHALDVACGTGHSTVALKEIAERVVGCDISGAMLKSAERDDSIDYLQSTATNLPFADDTFPLLTICMGFHWLDRTQFLPEAWRVLADNGRLVIYNYGKGGGMTGNPAYQEWYESKFQARYPWPARSRPPINAEEASQYGFEYLGEEQFEHQIRSSPEQLALGLTTQSSVIVKVEEGAESIDSAYAWLLEQVTPFFTHDKESFKFGGPIWYLRKG